MAKWWDNLPKRKAGVLPVGSLAYTGTGDNDTVEPNKPVKMVNTPQGPRMIHEGEMEVYGVNGQVQVVPQKKLAEYERRGNIPGFQEGGTYEMTDDERLNAQSASWAAAIADQKETDSPTYSSVAALGDVRADLARTPTTVDVNRPGGLDIADATKRAVSGIEGVELDLGLGEQPDVLKDVTGAIGDIKGVDTTLSGITRDTQQYEDVFKQGLNTLAQYASGESKVDTNITNVALDRFESAFNAQKSAAYQRIASDPNMSEGAKKAAIATLSRDQGLARSQMNAELALAAQERAYNANSKLTEMGLAGAQFKEGQYQTDLDRGIAILNADLQKSIAAGELTLESAKLKEQQWIDKANIKLQEVDMKLQQAVTAGDLTMRGQQLLMEQYQTEVNKGIAEMQGKVSKSIALANFGLGAAELEFKWDQWDYDKTWDLANAYFKAGGEENITAGVAVLNSKFGLAIDAEDMVNADRITKNNIILQQTTDMMTTLGENAPEWQGLANLAADIYSDNLDMLGAYPQEWTDEYNSLDLNAKAIGVDGAEITLGEDIRTTLRLDEGAEITEDLYKQYKIYDMYGIAGDDVDDPTVQQVEALNGILKNEKVAEFFASGNGSTILAALFASGPDDVQRLLRGTMSLLSGDVSTLDAAAGTEGAEKLADLMFGIYADQNPEDMGWFLKNNSAMAEYLSHMGYKTQGDAIWNTPERIVSSMNVLDTLGVEMSASRLAEYLNVKNLKELPSTISAAELEGWDKSVPSMERVDAYLDNPVGKLSDVDMAALQERWENSTEHLSTSSMLGNYGIIKYVAGKKTPNTQQYDMPIRIATFAQDNAGESVMINSRLYVISPTEPTGVGTERITGGAEFYAGVRVIDPRTGLQYVVKDNGTGLATPRWSLLPVEDNVGRTVGTYDQVITQEASVDTTSGGYERYVTDPTPLSGRSYQI